MAPVRLGGPLRLPGTPGHRGPIWRCGRGRRRGRTIPGCAAPPGCGTSTAAWSSRPCRRTGNRCTRRAPPGRRPAGQSPSQVSPRSPCSRPRSSCRRTAAPLPPLPRRPARRPGGTRHGGPARGRGRWSRAQGTTKRPVRPKSYGPLQRSISDLQASGTYLTILVTWPAPTVRPPSRMANFRPSSMATGWISETVISVLSPGMTISVPSGRVTTPVTSVVRK